MISSNVHWRQYRITVQVSWVDHLDDVLIGEPQSSVRRLGCVWPERSRHRFGRRSKHVKESGLHRSWSGPIFHNPLQLRIWDRNKSARRVKPKRSFPVRDEGINDIAREAVPHRESLPPLPLRAIRQTPDGVAAKTEASEFTKKAWTGAIARALIEREEFHLAISVSGQATRS